MAKREKFTDRMVDYDYTPAFWLRVIYSALQFTIVFFPVSFIINAYANYQLFTRASPFIIVVAVLSWLFGSLLGAVLLMPLVVLITLPLRITTWGPRLAARISERVARGLFWLGFVLYAASFLPIWEFPKHAAFLGVPYQSLQAEFWLSSAGFLLVIGTLVSTRAFYDFGGTIWQHWLGKYKWAADVEDLRVEMRDDIKYVDDDGDAGPGHP